MNILQICFIVTLTTVRQTSVWFGGLTFDIHCILKLFVFVVKTLQIRTCIGLFNVFCTKMLFQKRSQFIRCKQILEISTNKLTISNTCTWYVRQIYKCLVGWFLVFNATFNSISVISWRSVLLVEETTDLSQVTDKFYHIMLYQVHLAWTGFEITTLVVIGSDCTMQIQLSMLV
jgi:hypothetical protein